MTLKINQKMCKREEKSVKEVVVDMRGQTNSMYITSELISEELGGSSERQYIRKGEYPAR